MSDRTLPVNRALVGILALGCLTTGALVGYFSSVENVWCGSSIRAGVLLGAFWLALPSRRRAAAWANISPWSLAAALGLALIFVRRPQVFFAIIVLVVIAAIVIRPRTRR